jgi:DNA-binding MarR family transcriptional regulator
MQHLAQVLSQAERRVTRQLATVLEREGCTVEQWRTLTLLADGQSHPMAEIAEVALLPAPSVTRLVDRMVADNLVYRKPDDRDRRRVLVRITRRGRDLHRRLAVGIEREQDAILARTGERELAQVVATLSGLVRRLR